jgi:hypothetical protein
MKKVILGATMMFAGMVSSAMLMAGSMAQDLQTKSINEDIINSQGMTESYYIGNEVIPNSWHLILTAYGLTPILIIFVLIAVIGFLICTWSVWEKEVNKLINKS